MSRARSLEQVKYACNATEMTCFSSRQAVGANFLRVQIRVLAVARQNVVEARGHLQRLDALLHIFPGLGILFVVCGFNQRLAGGDIDAQEAQAAVEKNIAARDATAATTRGRSTGRSTASGAICHHRSPLRK